MLKPFSTAFLVSLTVACASSGPGERRPEGDRAGGAGQARPAPALAAARKLKSEKGCAAAAPTYRVTAAMGEGFEVAQSELGFCLLRMTGDTDAETALFEQEGVFWLTRAAYAGEARAQRRLAEHAHAAGDDEAALGWALAFAANSQTDLFSLSPLPGDFIAQASASLSDAQIEAAQQFADRLPAIKMAGYTPTQGSRERPQAGQRAAGQTGRRPRRAGLAN
ncbi:MAG: hypothetical protein AAGJ73_12525 [Pseudomonadota bacterium]